jgi:hypothetical protein
MMAGHLKRTDTKTKEFYQVSPNFVVEFSTLLLRIMEIQGSNVGRRSTILTEVLRGFPQCLQVNAGIVL